MKFLFPATIPAAMLAILFCACSDGPGISSCVDETCMSICADRECGPSAYNSDYSCGTCGNGWDCQAGTCVRAGDDVTEQDDTQTDSGTRDVAGNDAATDDTAGTDTCETDGCGGDEGATDDGSGDTETGDVGCIPECGDLECGNDPLCNQPCGECSGLDLCIEGKCVCQPYTGRECGEDGCGGSFGECPSDGQVCEMGQCVEPTVYDMISIPGGQFSMGCSTDDTTACSSDEKPAHTVSISEFQIDRTEVTQAKWAKCVEAGACDKPNCEYDPTTTPERPVTCVTWKDANAYCTWLGRRLPTEAEWEYAARFNDGRMYPWGDSAATCTYANMYYNLQEGCGTGSAANVCSKSTKGDSFLGLCDMAGNVWEWVYDYYGSYSSTSIETDPDGAASGLHLVRGGGFNFDVLSIENGDVRSTNRYAIAVDSGITDYIGFRCAR